MKASRFVQMLLPYHRCCDVHNLRFGVVHFRAVRIWPVVSKSLTRVYRVLIVDTQMKVSGYPRVFGHSFWRIWGNRTKLKGWPRQDNMTFNPLNGPAGDLIHFAL